MVDPAKACFAERDHAGQQLGFLSPILNEDVLVHCASLYTRLHSVLQLLISSFTFRISDYFKQLFHTLSAFSRPQCLTGVDGVSSWP